MVKPNTINNTKPACCSTRQKVYGIIALAGLFACGVMIGVAMNGRNIENAAWKKQCDTIANNIVKASSETYLSSDSMARLEKLNDMYSRTCAGHTFKAKDIEKVAVNSADMEPVAACKQIEVFLLNRLGRYAGINMVNYHKADLEIYKELAEKGCPENVEKYKEFVAQESAVIEALEHSPSLEQQRTCAEIERLLNEQVLTCGSAYDSYCHINIAKVYANMSERGCPENHQKYVGLAAKELEIARALQDDNFSESDTIEVVETYKRLKMKQAANEILDKVQKLTDPAIDFILQVQKIIEE